MYDLSEKIELDKNQKHDIEIVVDRLVLRGEEIRARLTESIETASKLSGGMVGILFPDIKDEDDYLRSKNLDYRFENDEKELVQLAIQSYHELRYISMGGGDGVLNKFRLLNGKAVSIAERLFAEKKLDSFAESGESFGAVYDLIVSDE